MTSREVLRHRLRLQRAEGRFAVSTPFLVRLVELLHGGRSLAYDGTGSGFLRATASARRFEVFRRAGRTRTRFISTLNVRRSTVEMPSGRERLESCSGLAALVGFATVVAAAASC